MDFIDKFNKQKTAVVTAGLLLIVFFFSYGSQFFTLKKTRYELSSTQITVGALKDSCGTLNRHIEYLTMVINKYKEQISVLTEKLSKSESEKAALQSTIASLNARIRKLEGKNRAIMEEFRQAVAAHKLSEKRAAEMQQDMDALEDELLRVKAEANKTTNALAKTSEEFEQEKKEKERLEAEKHDFEQMQNTDLRLKKGALYNHKGKEIKEGKKVSGWKSSYFEIAMNNPDARVIQGRFFGVEIVEVDKSGNVKAVELEISDAIVFTSTMFVSRLSDNELRVNIPNKGKLEGKMFKLNVYYIPDRDKPENRIFLSKSDGLYFVVNGQVFQTA